MLIQQSCANTYCGLGIRNVIISLAGVAQWIEHQPVNKRNIIGKIIHIRCPQETCNLAGKVGVS